MKLGEESNPSHRTRNMAYSPENLEFWVNSREYSRPIQRASYPPFKKGTSILHTNRSPQSK